MMSEVASARGRMTAGAGSLGLGLVLVASMAVVAAPPDAYADGPNRPAVIGRRVIGHSVQGRPLRAWHVGDPRDATTVVAMATMHGDEPAPRHTLMRLRDGARIRGVNLWLLPTVNPDGLARGS
ncbi:MAG: M14 family zinc carboxypeptidase, partial [Nocardioidaceae bacterium]